MRAIAVAVGILILLTYTAAVMAADEQRYGYITVEEVTVLLRNNTATISVDYSVDEGTRIVFFLLGKQDLKNKLSHILNYPNAQMRRVTLNSAEIFLPNASYSYGKGIYWYPSHEFNVVIPSLTIVSPQVTKSYSMTSTFPNGMGYFDGKPDEIPPPQPRVPA